MIGYSELGVVSNVGPDLSRWALARDKKVRLNFPGSFEGCPSEDLCSCTSSCVWHFNHSSSLANIHPLLCATHLFRPKRNGPVMPEGAKDNKQIGRRISGAS